MLGSDAVVTTTPPEDWRGCIVDDVRSLKTRRGPEAAPAPASVTSESNAAPSLCLRVLAIRNTLLLSSFLVFLSGASSSTLFRLRRRRSLRLAVTSAEEEEDGATVASQQFASSAYLRGNPSTSSSSSRASRSTLSVDVGTVAVISTTFLVISSKREPPLAATVNLVRSVRGRGGFTAGPPIPAELVNATGEVGFRTVRGGTSVSRLRTEVEDRPTWKECAREEKKGSSSSSSVAVAASAA
mmetsp:Transcript_14396/g.27379  ORF Transcript_14396/g.27379 Transcript_14396/m.27379 type:complete len:241 (-) Transcript_14396:149-871(-)